MGSRERQRAGRRKRKERSVERRAESAARREASAERIEAKNQAARDQLEPLGEDERPGVVTVAAAISALLALTGVVLYALGVEVADPDESAGDEGTPGVFPVVVSTIILSAMAYGLWRARYWAVLGFQTVLVIVIVLVVLALVQVTQLAQALALAAILGLASFLFYRMIKAMARIQMPERRPPA